MSISWGCRYRCGDSEKHSHLTHQPQTQGRAPRVTDRGFWDIYATQRPCWRGARLHTERLVSIGKIEVLHHTAQKGEERK